MRFKVKYWEPDNHYRLYTAEDDLLAGIAFPSQELAAQAAEVMNRGTLHTDLRRLLRDFGLQNVISGLCDLSLQQLLDEGENPALQQVLLDLEVFRNNPNLIKASEGFYPLRLERMAAWSNKPDAEAG